MLTIFLKGLDMAKYMRKSYEVNAVQWTGNNEQEVDKFLHGMGRKARYTDDFVFSDGTGARCVHVGGWIVEEDSGYYHILSNMEFHKEYESKS